MNIPHSLAPTILGKSPVGPLHSHIGSFAETLAKQGYSSSDLLTSPDFF